MATVDPVELKVEVGRSSGNVWAACVDTGIKAQEMLNEGRWIIGDLACVIANHSDYGENTLGMFADDIHFERARVREYRTVSQFWTFSVRTELLLIANLMYSHFRIATRLQNLRRARDFLLESADNDWSVGRARIELNKRLGKPLPPLQLLNAAEVCIVGIDGSIVRLDVVNIDLECNDALMDACRSGKPVKVVISEVEAKTS